MSVLADRDIRAELEAGRIRIEPYDPADLQPSSVDLHLDRSFRVFRNNRYAYIDPREAQPDLTELLGVRDDEPFILHPGEFVLGQTLEWVELPDDLVARLEGKALALDTAVRNVARSGVALPRAVAAASREPLALLGVTDRGRLEPGQRADLVELDDDLVVRRVMRGGRWYPGPG